MKQVLQNLKSGELLVEKVPAPLVKPGHLLIQTTCSLISAGTERMVVDFGRANYLQKAKQKPDKVKQVLQKAKTDGVIATMEAVKSRLDQPIPLGYSNVGTVIEIGAGVAGYEIGDRVVSNGRHAEIVCVPTNLCAKIPDTVTDEQASFTVVSSIALQGIRLIEPTIGENVCVMGLGLIGLVAAQILKAGGMRVIGFDFDKNRVEMAKNFGIEAYDLSTGIDPVKSVMEFTNGHGTDAVLITAATKSNDVIAQSAQMSRKRGRIVLTGVVGLDIDRNDFYEKELSFQVSCSYGPGRYDPKYEDQGIDYPYDFVRWTEQRNFEAILNLLSNGSIDIEPLLSKTVDLDKAKQAYDDLGDSTKIGILLNYPDAPKSEKIDNNIVTLKTEPHPASAEGTPTIGLIGAGGFTTARILPALSKTNARLKWVASASGVTGANAARRFDIENNTSDYTHILKDKEVNAVFITTRHNSHAKFVTEALKAGKHVFVEKPLCLNKDELQNIQKTYDEACKKYKKQLICMVGFNRRFSPLATEVKTELLTRQSPASFIYTVNAGFIPADHWVQDLKIGGGRIIGEGCHFIDFLYDLAKSPITSVHAISHDTGAIQNMNDNVTIALGFADGSIGQVNYLAGGHKNYPKERCDIFFDGKAITLDNFKKLTGYGTKTFRRKNMMRQDKGHNAEVAAFIDAITHGQGAPINFQDICHVMDVTFDSFEQITAKSETKTAVKTQAKAKPKAKTKSKATSKATAKKSVAPKKGKSKKTA